MSGPSLTQHEFELLRGLVRHQIGIVLPDSKRVLLEARLRQRLRERDDESFTSYYRHVCGEAGHAELQELVDAVTTNVTAFFREPSHLHALAEEMAPVWRCRASRVRIWSAACATGQEPYSIAAVMLAAMQGRPGLDWKVLGTDVSMRALRAGLRARYPARSLDEIPLLWRAPFRVSGRGAAQHVSVSDELRARVVLLPLNLMAERYPFSGSFDAIFCRNVLIYFDAATRQQLIAKLLRVVAPGGYLILGLSESLVELPRGLRSVGRSIYQRAMT